MLSNSAMNRFPLLAIALLFAGPSAARAAPERAPDWTLESRAQLSAKFAPAIQKYGWSGPNDLSAKVWLWREGAAAERALMLRVDVTDDAFVQPFKGQDAWKADGLQVGLGAPDAENWFEVGLSRWPEGRAAAHVFRSVPDLENPWDKIEVSATPRAGGLIYKARFPMAAMGLRRRTFGNQRLALQPAGQRPRRNRRRWAKGKHARHRARFGRAEKCATVSHRQIRARC